MIFYLLALLSPLAFAFGTVLQQRGTLETAAREGDPRFFAQMLRKPVWLLGGFATVCAWALQAAALRFGSLAVVQALQALSLVFAIPMGIRLTRQRLTRRSGIAAGATLLGLVAFVLLGQPQGGTSHPGWVAWLAAGLATAVVTAGLSWPGFRYRGPAAAALLGTAAGVCFALQAALTKVLVDELGRGAEAILAGWPLYVFMLAAVLGFALQQASLKTGSLAPALAALEAATLAVSVLFAATVFDEEIARSVGRLLLAVAGLAVAMGGVVLLSLTREREAATLTRGPSGP
jgi:drug/metabolite transporter (DMT)-like permease